MKYFDIYSQLMRKKIVLEVDKLLHKGNTKDPTTLHPKPLPERKATFDQLYRQAKKSQSRPNLNATSYYHNHHSAPTSFHSLYDSLKGSRNTPKNSNRRGSEQMHHKLNRSLEAKGSELERETPGKRSASGDRRKQGERRGQKMVEDRREKQHVGLKHRSWDGQEQFQKDWRAALATLDHNQHQHLRQTECFLSLHETSRILRTLHYLRKVEDEKQLMSLWHELEGETYGGIPSNNLREFLGLVNYCQSQSNLPREKSAPGKRLVIDSNLRLVVSQAGRIQIYEDFLGLRVNRILYGESGKQGGSSANIRIEDGDNLRRKIVLARRGGATSQLTRQKKSEQITRVSEEEDQELPCLSELSEPKEEGQQEAPSEPELIEEVVVRKPILSVDVNLGEGVCEKLTVFEGETAFQVSRRLVEKYNIQEGLRAKFETMLSGHIRNLLYRIDEVSEELFSDREE